MTKAERKAQAQHVVVQQANIEKAENVAAQERLEAATFPKPDATQMGLTPSVINTEENLPRKVVPPTRPQDWRPGDSPMILMPTVVEDGPQAGQTVMVPVSADEVYNESKSGIDALQRLAKCLGGGGT
tara:strand:+ start:34 stop:417 length:384 start_codon:yes stop_codon:yes gene_type:complete